jgi:hypothetical protein
VRAFVDFLVERVKFDADYMEELCPNHRCCEAELEIATATAAASIGPMAPSAPAVVAEA